MVVNYSLTIKNSSRSRDVIFVAHIQAVIQGEGDQLIFQRESLFQRFAEVGKRLLKLTITILSSSRRFRTWAKRWKSDSRWKTSSSPSCWITT